MGEPTTEPITACAPLFPLLGCELETIFLLTVEEVGELIGRTGIDDDRILLIVPRKTAGVEVG